MTDVAVFGSVNLDRTERVSVERVERLASERDPFPSAGETITVAEPPPGFDPVATRLGGKGANQIVAAARADASASIHGAIGPDATEFDVREQFTAEGVDPQLFDRETETGAAYIWVTPDGENRIVVVAGANGTLTPADAADRAPAIGEATVLLLQNEIPVPAAIELLDRLPDPGPTVVVDPAPTAGAEPLVTHEAVDLLVPNEREFDALQASLRTATRAGATIVRTEGADGASIFADLDGRPRYHVTAPDVDAVDTTGAGDAFIGYLGAELAGDRTLKVAVEVAVRAGSRSCETSGAMSAPHRDAL